MVTDEIESCWGHADVLIGLVLDSMLKGDLNGVAWGLLLIREWCDDDIKMPITRVTIHTKCVASFGAWHFSGLRFRPMD